MTIPMTQTIRILIGVAAAALRHAIVTLTAVREVNAS